MGTSIRAAARHLNISDTTLRRLIARGRIEPNADGTLDLERTRKQYAANVRPRVDRPGRAEHVTGC